MEAATKPSTRGNIPADAVPAYLAVRDNLTLALCVGDQQLEVGLEPTEAMQLAADLIKIALAVGRERASMHLSQTNATILKAAGKL